MAAVRRPGSPASLRSYSAHTAGNAPDPHRSTGRCRASSTTRLPVHHHVQSQKTGSSFAPNSLAVAHSPRCCCPPLPSRFRRSTSVKITSPYLISPLATSLLARGWPLRCLIQRLASRHTGQRGLAIPGSPLPERVSVTCKEVSDAAVVSSVGTGLFLRLSQACVTCR